MNTVDILLAAKDKVIDGWTQHARARDADGNAQPDGKGWALLEPWDPRAVAWCLGGAIEGAQGYLYGEASAIAIVGMIVTSHGFDDIQSFNDYHANTKWDVVAVLDEAILKAKELDL